MNYSEEQLNKAFEDLPEDIQTAIADAETEKKVNAIGQRHNLHIDQIGNLADETGLIMLGLKHPNSFTANLSGRLGISTVEAEIIAQEINTEVFANLREAIRQRADGLASGSNQDPAGKMFEEKVSQMFSTTPEKPWEQDPYLADPSKT